MSFLDLEKETGLSLYIIRLSEGRLSAVQLASKVLCLHESVQVKIIVVDNFKILLTASTYRWAGEYIEENR
jgi:hypothetical protein